MAGGLANNIWGFDSSDRLNSFLFQYFINYNLDRGWYLVSAPVLTADWNAEDGNRWTVPFGGGIGKVFAVGSQPINLNVQAFSNVDRPENYGEWTLRVQLQFMFPR